MNVYPDQVTHLEYNLRNCTPLMFGVGVLVTLACSDSRSRAVRGNDDFLGGLAGAWVLTGSMGATALRQHVDAKWVLHGNFLKMHFTQDAAGAASETSYEAIYMLSFDSASAQYALHLFDTFGPGYSHTIGIGTRRGDSVQFLFDYPSGLFSNTFVRHAEKDQWEMILSRQDDTGRWMPFATKALARDKGTRRGF